MNDDGLPILSAEASRLKEFKDILDRDTSEDKGEAKDILAFIYFMGSAHPENPYRILDRDSRLKELQSSIPSINPVDPITVAGLGAYIRMEDRHSVALSYVRSNISALNKLKGLLDKMDVLERDDFGKLVNDPKVFLDLINKAVVTVTVLADLEKKVLQGDVLNDSKIRGGGKEEFDL